ncbi:TetR family transcriptional regulator [Kitasatospora sp. NPDC059827]|uniref:TetR family transcriptional regulator n=1 Tax=Kitasatospora sp. NPDC059827 TaxID=3346964 RepID=UPI00365E7D01
MQRDAEATKQRLIAAGRAEFAAHGLHGARVDRIAEAARSNKAQIYHYFHSKVGLFDAVWNSAVEQIIGSLPFDGDDDLPEFAARLSDIYAEHPEIPRLITWQNLERGDEALNGYAVDEVRRRTGILADAQARGVVSDRFEARFLFALMVHLAMLWPAMAPEVRTVVDFDDAAQRRELVRRVAAGLLD